MRMREKGHVNTKYGKESERGKGKLRTGKKKQVWKGEG